MKPKDMAPGRLPVSPEEAEKMRETLGEYDDIVADSRWASAEKTLGQLGTGAGVGGLVSWAGVAVYQKAHEVLAENPGLGDKAGNYFTGGSILVGAIGRVVQRRRQHVRVWNYIKKRLSKSSETPES